MTPLWILSPGDARPEDALAAWLHAVGEAGAPTIVLREPGRPIDAVARLLTVALAAAPEVVLHLRTPGALALAVARGLLLHAPADAPVPALPHARSCHDAAELDAAFAAGARWAMVSPVWAPASKPADRRPPLGLTGFVTLARGRPVLALGGVNPERRRALAARGYGAAVLGATSGDPRSAADAVRALLGEASGQPASRP